MLFKLVAGWFCISNLRAAVRIVKRSAVVPAGSIGWVMTVGVQERYTQVAVNVGYRLGILTEASHKVS